VGPLPKFELRVYPREILFSSPYARMPTGRYHCPIKFKNYFFSNDVYLRSARRQSCYTLSSYSATVECANYVRREFRSVYNF